MIDKETLDLINEKTDIVSLVQEFVQLEKVGKNYRGLCPFHNEKTPSFYVSPEKNITKCYGCKEGGNPVNFYRKIKGITLTEAATELASRLGIEIKNKQIKKVDANEKYFKIYEEAADFYQLILNNSESGKNAFEYLSKREIDTDTIRHFKIGLAPNKKDSLYNFLNTKGYKVSDMIDLGLVKQNEAGEYYDLFTSRIMFPVKNPEGKIAGFSGRAIRTSETIKYVNSPESVIFKKGTLLYNYYESLPDIRKNRQIILSEGFFDCIQPYKIGIKNCVASMGTALTDDQISLIKKVTSQVLIMYDGDSAGQNATRDAIFKMIQSDLKVEVLVIPERLDPDEFIRQYGGEKFEGLFSGHTVDAYRFIFDYYKRNKNFQNANDCIQFKNEMSAFLTQAPVSVRDLYTKIIYEELGIKLGLKDDYKEIPKTITIKKPKTYSSGKYDKLELLIIIAILKDPGTIPFIKKHFIPYIDIRNESIIPILDFLINSDAASDKPSLEDLLRHFHEEKIRSFINNEIATNEIYVSQNETNVINTNELEKYKKKFQERPKKNDIIEVSKKIDTSDDDAEKIRLGNERLKLRKEK